MLDAAGDIFFIRFPKKVRVASHRMRKKEEKKVSFFPFSGDMIEMPEWQESERTATSSTVMSKKEVSLSYVVCNLHLDDERMMS